MAGIPAKCRSCGSIVEARGFIGGTARGVQLAGNTYRPCPECGGLCDVLDGTYDVVESVATLLSGPETTLNALMAAATIAKVAKAAGASDEEVLQKASVAMPVLASAKGMLRNMAIAALLFIGERLAESAYEWATDSAPVTKGELHEVVRDAVAQAMEARDAAASNAGIEELERLRAASEQRPQLKLSPNITISHATMERLQRDAMARYRKSSGATERGE